MDIDTVEKIRKLEAAAIQWDKNADNVDVSYLTPSREADYRRYAQGCRDEAEKLRQQI